jgi:deoxyribonuclease V
MIACVDVGYFEDNARAACVAFEQWEDADVRAEFVLNVPDVQPYVPGHFYRRELPCLLSVLDQLSTRPDTVVIDGYVWLDENGRKGLGGHLFGAFGEAISVIGVAKTRFATATSSVEVLRGSSDRPLFVTAAGIDQAAACIRRMHGENRIPTLLKQVDRLSRTKAAT